MKNEPLDSSPPSAEAERPAGETDATAELLAALDELYPLPDDARRVERAGRTSAVVQRWVLRAMAEIEGLIPALLQRARAQGPPDDATIADLLQQVSARTSERDQAREAIAALEQFHAGEASHLRRLLAGEERKHLQTIDERDNAQEWADKLAYAVASEDEIGEHSNLNNPWANALELLEARAALSSTGEAAASAPSPAGAPETKS